mgnify:FL=1
MAHFAKLDDNNVVLNVLVVDDSNAATEEEGITFLTNLTGYTNWKQTSYNTVGNARYLNGDYAYTDLNGTPFRGNFAHIGGSYDAENDICWHQKTYPSWVKNVTTATWDPPVARPDDYSSVMYDWIEETQSWQAVD